MRTQRRRYRSLHLRCLDLHACALKLVPSLRARDTDLRWQAQVVQRLQRPSVLQKMRIDGAHEVPRRVVTRLNGSPCAARNHVIDKVCCGDNTPSISLLTLYGSFLTNAAFLFAKYVLRLTYRTRYHNFESLRAHTGSPFAVDKHTRRAGRLSELNTSFISIHCHRRLCLSVHWIVVFGIDSNTSYVVEIVIVQ